MNLINHWGNDYWKLFRKVLNGKRTIQEAYKYMEENYTGSNHRKAIRHQMECTSSDSTLELTLLHQLKDAMKLGFGKDVNFERAFR